MSIETQQPAPVIPAIKGVFAPDPGVRALLSKHVAPGSDVLDAGTGSGRNAIHAARLGHTVVGVDANPEYINQANAMKLLVPEKIDVAFTVAEIEAFQPEQEDFDAVLLTRVLQEIGSDDRGQRVVTKLQQLTAPAGSNIVTAYIGTDADRDTMSHLLIFAPDEVEAMYEDEGWEIAHRHQEIKKLGFFAGKPICKSFVELVAVKPE